ncbi:MAG: hypothetical protein L6V86_08690 [Treponema sp.]|nr:MAG: hypothetical protein L6V86_08690 [Treponema sp.]
MTMEKLVVGDFLSWRSFAEYAERHYLGLLDELSEMNLSVLTREILFVFCMTTW